MHKYSIHQCIRDKGPTHGVLAETDVRLECSMQLCREDPSTSGHSIGKKDSLFSSRPIRVDPSSCTFTTNHYAQDHLDPGPSNKVFDLTKVLWCKFSQQQSSRRNWAAQMSSFKSVPATTTCSSLISTIYSKSEFFDRIENDGWPTDF